ncbi:MAG: FG-GAP-like repeat-containing protein [Planctomycetota bacterium]
MTFSTLPLPWIAGVLVAVGTPSLLAQDLLRVQDIEPPAGGRSVHLYWGDYDVDGLRDALAITVEGRLTLLRNSRNGRFEDMTRTVGLDAIEHVAFASWHDFDGDGRLDLFVGTRRGPSHLMRNQGGAFVDVAEQSGITAEGHDRSARWVDYDGDGRLDLHLLTDGDNTLYHALAFGGFEAVPLPELLQDAGGPDGRERITEAPRQGPRAEGSGPQESPPAPRGGGDSRADRGSPMVDSGGPPAQDAPPSPASGRRPLPTPGTGRHALDAGAAQKALQPLPQQDLDCADALLNAGGGGCIQASDVATLGMLYPLSDKFFVAPSGNVGIGTTSPVHALEVAGEVAAGGSTSANHFRITGNQIQQRQGANPAKMHLNLPGGDVSLAAEALLVAEAGLAWLKTPVPGAEATIIFSDGVGAFGGGNWAIGNRSNDDFFIDEFGILPRLTIQRVSGNVGINTTAPAFKLEVNGSAGKPGGGSWSVSSDARLKKNVRGLEGALDTLLALRGVTFEYKDPEAIHELPGERIGFIAQEVERVVPDWVEDAAGYKRLTIRGFEALAVEALREMSRRSEALAAENRELRARVADLESLADEVASLETRLTALAVR